MDQTPEQIVATAIEEDADAIGLSVHPGARVALFGSVLDLVRERGSTDIVVFAHGIIPSDDVPELTALGVAEVFTLGASTQRIVNCVRANRGEAAASSSRS